MAYEQTITAAAPEVQIPLDSSVLDAAGQRLFRKFEEYKKDRKALEEQWLRNLRQFRGIYDPEIESAIAKDRSKAYPKVTRKKVINTVSRLMEMLFPQTEKNYAVNHTPMPDLSQADMQKLLDEMGMPAEGQPLNEVQVEAAIVELAKARATKMELTIDDQLSELDWVTLARKVIFSGVLYGPGIVKGPLILKKKKSTYRFDAPTQKYIAREIERLYPYFEFVSVWSYYPDLSAKDRKSMDDFFERHVMSRQQIMDLAARPDFMAERVNDYLRDNQQGDLIEEWWELQLRQTGDRSNPTNLLGRKYLGLEYWGFASGHELFAAGIAIPAADFQKMFEASVFMLGRKVVKLKINPYQSKRRPDHVFVYEDDDINAMGSGLPPVVRDSQLAICETARMALDNGSVVCGPMLEMNIDLLMPGQDLSIHAYKVFYREDEDRAGVPAVREIKVDSHIAELTSLIQLFMQFADDETGLPPTSTGDVSKGGTEALRTQGNMSMIMSAGALPIRDTVRNFDVFLQSVVSSLVDWNMQFNPDPAIKGDYVVLAKGSTSLIAKEVRALSLDNFKATLTPDELVYVKPGIFVRERGRARDIPSEVFEDDATVKKKLDAQAADAQAQRQQQDALMQAQVRKVLSEAVENLAQAGASESSAQTEVYKAIMEAVTNAQPKPDRKAA
jgi:hypothetical protein